MALEVRLYKNNNWLKRSGYTITEEGEVYDEQLQDIVANPRWYLDNLDYLCEYRVSWKNYRHTNPTKPREFVKITKHL